MIQKIFFTILCFLFFISSPAIAADLNVDCDGSGSCAATGLTPLFSSADGLWYPGRILARTFELKNSDTASHQMGFMATRNGAASILEDALTVSVVGPSFLWAGHLIDFYNAGEINVGTFDSGTTAAYTFTASFDTSAGNDYQDKSAIFDLTLGFIAAPPPSPITNPSSGIYLNEVMPAPSDNQEWVELYNANSADAILIDWQFDDIEAGGGSPKALGTITIPALSYYVIELGGSYLNNSGDSARLINNLGAQVDIFTYTSTTSTESWSKQPDTSWCLATPTKSLVNNSCLGGGGGAGGGASPPGPPTCGDAVPGTPTNLIATIISSSQVRLDWTHAPAPYTSYLIAYGPSLGDYLYGNPNIGTANSYIVGSLTPGAQYCFYVRAQNGCMPGSRSNEVCVNAGSAIPATAPPAPGFIPGVLGTQAETITPTPPPEGGEIGGVTTLPCQKYWLPILYLIALIINLLYLHRQAELEPGKRSLWRFILPPILSLFLYWVDSYLLQTRCCLVAPAYCRYFWVGNIFALVVPVLFYHQVKEK